ncbi:hypothetical protein N431DRAFT_465288 [Stipitochalara longipes BDJ]|nr:hypothetical protein N431DRAFT_465288 [Stipitochalara longipes BDJ]
MSLADQEEEALVKKDLETAVQFIEMRTDFYETATSRRLFITANGFLGIGPAEIEVGDRVSILFGGNVPFIVRDEDDGYSTLVGECYCMG